MTELDWLQVLAPSIGIVATGVVGVVGAVLTGVSGRVRDYFEAKGQAETAKAIGAAAHGINEAAENAVGRIVLKVQTGELDIRSIASLQRAAQEEAEGLADKMPRLFGIANPVAGAITGMIVGKFAREGGHIAAAVLDDIKHDIERSMAAPPRPAPLGPVRVK